MKHVIYTTVLILVLLCMTEGCSGNEGNDSIKEARDIAGLGVIKILDLDNPENPYKDAYEPWDEWVYQSIVLDPSTIDRANLPENFKILKARVTQDGFLLPQLEKIKIYHEDKLHGGDRSEVDIKEIAPYAVQSAAIMSPEMSEELRFAVYTVMSEYYSEVPKWLVDNLPHSAMLLPNGDVVTFGALGSYGQPFEGEITEEKVGCCGRSKGKESFYRYNADGELLITSPIAWWYLYFDKTEYTEPAAGRSMRPDGYFIYTDAETDEIVSVWNWDGTPLESTVLPPPRDTHPFIILKPIQLQGLYEAQNRN
ncbi:hypothetical protein JW859_07410 [bacterium]|nr:hypothetical protein [bacterium]